MGDSTTKATARPKARKTDTTKKTWPPAEKCGICFFFSPTTYRRSTGKSKGAKEGSAKCESPTKIEGRRWFEKEPEPCPERSGSDPDRKDRNDHREKGKEKKKERSDRSRCVKRSCAQDCELRCSQAGSPRTARMACSPRSMVTSNRMTPVVWDTIRCGTTL